MRIDTHALICFFQTALTLVAGRRKTGEAARARASRARPPFPPHAVLRDQLQRMRTSDTSLDEQSYAFMKAIYADESCAVAVGKSIFAKVTSEGSRERSVGMCGAVEGSPCL